MTADVEFGTTGDPATPSSGAPVRTPAMRAYCATLARFTSSVQSTEQLLRNDDAGTREDTEQREQTAATRLRGIHRASSAADDGLTHCVTVRSEYGLAPLPSGYGLAPLPAEHGHTPLPADDARAPLPSEYNRAPLPADDAPGPAPIGRPAADHPPAGHLLPDAPNRPDDEPTTHTTGRRSSRAEPDPDYGPPTAHRPPDDDTLGFGSGYGPPAGHTYASRPAGAGHVPLGDRAAAGRADLSLRGATAVPEPGSADPTTAGPAAGTKAGPTGGATTASPTAAPTAGGTTTAGPTGGAATAVHTDPVVHRAAHQLDDPTPTLDRLRRTGGADLGVALTALGRRRDELKLAETEFETWLVAHDERSRRVTLGAVVGAGLAGAAVMVVAGTRTSAAMTLALLIVCTLAVVAVGLGVAAAGRLPRVCRGGGLARRPDAAALVRYGARIGGAALLALTAANIAAGAF